MREDSNADSGSNTPADEKFSGSSRGACGSLAPAFPLCAYSAVDKKRQLGCRTPYRSGGGAADAHAVEGTVDEEEGDGEEGGCKDVRQAVAALAGGELHGELDG